jgi:disulfide bond formation protein DsbB
LAFSSAVVTVFGLLAIGAAIMAAGLGGALILPAGRSALRNALHGKERHPITWAAAVPLGAMIGSLYLSEVAQLLPCSLCWYQRIAMYPLAIVLGVAAVRADPGVWRYGLPLALLGLGIAVYHVIIQWMPGLDVGACTTGAPCTGRYLAIFGFVSIPTMAASAFLLMIALLLLLRTLERGDGMTSQNLGTSLEQKAE